MEEVKVVLDNETTQFIVVRLGDEQYGIDIKYVDNIVRMQHITRVPKVQEYLKGVINLRGEVIPVMSARIKIVDEVKEVVTLENQQIDKVAYDSKEEKDYFIFGIGKYEDGGLISLLDLNAVVLDKDSI